MLFLIISIPLSILCAYLAYLTYRIKHKRTALGLSIVSLFSTIFSIGILGGINYLLAALSG